MTPVTLPPGLLLFLTGVTAMSVTWILLPQLVQIAGKIGLMDQPGGRKVHRIANPLVGGIGIVIGVIAACMFFVPVSNLRGLYTGILLLFIIGFLDDFREASFRIKFPVQILAALAMIYFSGATLVTFGDLLGTGDLRLGFVAVPLTVFCVVGVTNSVNMIDGVDGLAGGVSLIAFASFAILAWLNGQTELVMICAAFCGALIAFLRYNWFPSTLFMGDAGSLVLGFALAFLSVVITQKEGSVVPPVAALLIMAVPVTDAVVVMIRRMLRGKSPFMADKGHLHHILAALGYCKTCVARKMLLLAGLLSSVAVAGSVLKIPEKYLFAVFCGHVAMNVLFTYSMRGLARLKLREVKARTPLIYRVIDRLGYLSYIDRIAGVLTRGGIVKHLKLEMDTARKRGTPFSVVLFDIDHFKKINDEHGRRVGDLALYKIAELLKESARSFDIVGRVESDSFLVGLADTPLVDATRYAEDIREKIGNAPLQVNGGAHLNLSVTYAVVALEAGDRSAESLIHKAFDTLARARGKVPGARPEALRAAI